MKETDEKDKPARAGLSADLHELFDILKAYAAQETVGPLKGVGRYIAVGVAGSILLAIGALLVGLAGLRALQTETGTWFTGNLSWIPYFIMIVVAALAISMSIRAIMRGDGGEE